MSAIASFYVIKRGELVQLARVASQCAEADTSHGSAPFRRALAEHGRGVDEEYGWSGYCMVQLLSFLRWRGVRLRTWAFRSMAREMNRIHSYTVVTARPGRWSLARLDPARHQEDRLARHRLLRMDGFEEAGMAALDGLGLLHRQLSKLRDDEVLMVSIG